MTDRPSLSFIIPAYNEEECIQGAVEVTLNCLERAGVDFEIIIIDDGSKDDTRKIVEERFLHHPAIKFHSKPNEGFGSAIKKGIALSSKDYITFVPVDNPLTDYLLDTLLQNIGKGDILVGYRLERMGYSWRMKLNSRIYHFLISFLFGLRLYDYNWVHMYKRRIFDHIQVHNDYIFMLAETLIRANWHGYTFHEFPVRIKAREKGRQTAASLRAAVRTFNDMFLFYLESLPVQRVRVVIAISWGVYTCITYQMSTWIWSGIPTATKAIVVLPITGFQIAFFVTLFLVDLVLTKRDLETR